MSTNLTYPEISKVDRHASAHVPAHEQLAHWILIGLLVFMPLAFGAVEAWSGFVVMLCCLALLGCLGVRAWRERKQGGLIWSAAYLPVSLFILMGLLQVVPLPFGLIELLSPEAANLYIDLRSDIIGSFTLSLYPHETWRDLRVVIAAAVIFMTVVTFYRSSQSIKRLLLAVACIGAVLSLLALAQGFFGNGRIYWIGPQEVQPNSGTFACHNHLSQHMLLSVMAMLAYSMVSIREAIGRSWLDRESFADWLTSRELRGTRWLLFLSVLGLIAIVVSTSRMGTVSAALAIGAMVLIYATRYGVRRANIPIMVGLIAAGVAIIVGSEMLFERMGTLRDLDAYVDRWTVVRDLAPAIRDFPVIGSGLGTFAAVYPMYDTGRTWRFASHAENEYAQLLLEMGILGFALVAWFVIHVGRSAVRVFRAGDHPIYVAGAPLAAGLLGVMLHSWTDFGQHLLAIASLSAVFCGLLVVLAQRAAGRPGYRAKGSSKPEDPSESAQALAASPVTVFRRQSFLNASLGLMAMVLMLNLPAGFLQTFAEAFDTAALGMAERLEKAHWRGSDADYATLVSLGERAVQLDPPNVIYRYRLGVYRWWAEVRGFPDAAMDDQKKASVAATANQIVDEMISASAACPTMGSVHSWRGQLEWWVLGDASGRDRVEKGVRMAQNDRVTLYAAGLMAAADGDTDVAFERFRRSLEVRGNFRSAAEVLLAQSKRPDVALKLAGDDPQRLYELSDLLAKKGYPEEGLEARRRTLAVYESNLDDQKTPAWAMAMLADDHAKSGNLHSAIDLYGRALAREYANANWRAAYIRCMLAEAQLSEAEIQIGVLERVDPNSKLLPPLRAEFGKARRAAATQNVPEVIE